MGFVVSDSTELRLGHMNISPTSKYIRQQQAGYFRRPEDGKQPYAHVNETKLESAKEQKSRSVYVKNERVVSFEKEVSNADFPKLFDSDAGIRFNTERIAETKNKETPPKEYDKTAKGKTQKEEEKLINDWA